MRGDNEEMGIVWDGDCVRWGLCEMGTVWDGDRVRWGPCEMGTVWDGDRVRWGLCEMGTVWKNESYYFINASQNCLEWLRKIAVYIRSSWVDSSGLQVSVVHILAHRRALKQFLPVPCRHCLVPPYGNGARWCVTLLGTTVVTPYGLVHTVGVTACATMARRRYPFAGPQLDQAAIRHHRLYGAWISGFQQVHHWLTVHCGLFRAQVWKGKVLGFSTSL